MKKQDLVEKVHEVLGGTKVQAEQVVTVLFDEITDALKRGDEVAIPGFGKFVSKRREAQERRNPRTGEKVMSPAANVPKFKAAKALKDALNG